MRYLFGNAPAEISPALDSSSVLNPESFVSSEQLEGYAEQLAGGRVLRIGGTSATDFLALLQEEAQAIEIAEAELTGTATGERVPVEEWLHDNLYVVREQMWAVRRDLSRGYYHSLPKLADAPFAGLPRVYALACDLTARTGGRIDPEVLKRFVQAYQRVTELSIGELWALPSMLRAALLRHLAQLTKEVLDRRRQRAAARRFVTGYQRAVERAPATFRVDVHLPRTPSPTYIVQLIHDLRDLPPAASALWQELEERLGARDTRFDDITQQEHTREAFLQLAVSNLIGSMRRTSAIDWQQFVEDVSRVDEVLVQDPSGRYAQMDFETRDDYRRSVERLSRRSGIRETAVAGLALKLAQEDRSPDPRRQHIGYYLVDAGEEQLAKAAGAGASAAAWLKPLVHRQAAALYFTSLTALTALVVATLVAYSVRNGAPWWLAAVAALVSLLPASEIAVTMFHRIVTVAMTPRRLAKLDFSSGVPEDYRTLIIVPTLLTSIEGVARQLHDLEVRSLANHGGATQFGLLTDFVDAPSEHLENDDRLVQAAIDGIAALNERHGGARFVLLHRRRLWNGEEQKWMGWERKRGKLVELINYLRTGRRGTFSVVIGSESQLRASRFVLTVDADTQLPAGTVQRLAGALAHPLNRPRLDPIDRRVVEGYGVIQPRVEIDLESAEATPFAHAFSGGSGFDPYAKAVSDVYQDLFREGNFVGKGILDIEAFDASLAGRIPDNRLLSHDLFEGLFARTALCSDVHVIDEYPTHYLAWMARLHRWTRGDWQIASWLASSVPTRSGGAGRNVLPAYSRWKIFDNLRRSLLPPSLLVFLAFAWTVAPGSPGVWMLFGLLSVGLTALFELADAALARFRGVSLRAYFMAQRPRLMGLGLRLSLTIVFLADQAASLVDAIVRTLHRLGVTRRGLLEWEPAAAAGRRLRAERQHTYVVMWAGVVVAIALLTLTLAVNPDRLRWALPVAAAWLLAPELAYLTGRPRQPIDEYLSPPDRRYLRRTALRAWTFFEDFVTPEQHFLIPDNFQEDRQPQLVSRTSPTNIGLQLLADVAAHDFGYLTPSRVVNRVERVVETLEALPRYRGHFYNWYDTIRLQPLAPEYVSTVDSGNLAGHLLTVRQALVEMVDRTSWFDARFFDGLEDMVGVLTEQADRQLPSNAGLARALAVFSERLAQRPRSPSGWLWFLTELMERHAEIAAALAGSGGEVKRWSDRLHSAVVAGLADLESLKPAMAWLDRVAPEGDRDGPAELDANWIPPAAKLQFWVAAQLQRPVSNVSADAVAALGQLAADGRALEDRVANLNERLLSIALEMDFRFLYDERRGLFAIGYSAAENRLDGSFYDLLASEARLSSLLAIATDQIPLRHWFKLGRTIVAPTPSARALLSWSGSMFEYMMPVLVTKLFPHTLLAHTCETVIDCQIDYGQLRGVPWGFSEAAYALRDRAGNYQYKAFGTPGLGLKPGLAEELVVAPYATCLAAMLRPATAVQNLRKLERLGVAGRYGCYESVDYTPGDSERGTEVVRTYMAHHVGMSLAALDNVVHGDILQQHFHADARIRAVEQLLQEQLPLPGPIRVTPEMSASADGRRKVPTQVVRRYATPHTIGPRAHLLSNGHYLVMLTNAGGGFSAVGDTHVTRWREDAAQDCWGSFLYLRDLASGRFWSAAFQPTLVEPDDYEVHFELARARFRRRDGEIESILEVATGPDDAAEVRRLTLVNHGVTARDIEVTSYAEVTLAAALADQAHPAFSNLFVRTESPGPGALIAERRSREGGASEFAVHVLAGSDLGEVQHESDRARFVGRGSEVAAPAALRGQDPLSGTVGYVLDPVFSLRRRVTLGPRGRATVAFATAHARSHDEALALLAKYREPVSIDQAFFLARSRTDIELREFNLSPIQAMRFQRLASRMIHPDSRLRSVTAIARNRLPIRELWKHGISGDLPILLVRVTQPRDVDLVRELLTGHEYLRRRGYRSELVILNEHGASYRQELQEQLIRLCASGPWATYADQPGGVFLRSATTLSDDDRQLLEAVARVVCDGRMGSLEDQLRRAQRPAMLPSPFVATEAPLDVPPVADLEGHPAGRLQFWNGFGGFAPDGLSYEIQPDGRLLPPAPWTNVIANANFGCITTERGLACTWADNSQMRRLTPWSNDPVSDTPSEAIFIRDERTGVFWSATPAPRPGEGRYRVVHAFGATTYHAHHDEIESTLNVFVPPSDRVKIVTLDLRHSGSRSRELSVTFYADLQLSDRRSPAAPLIVTEQDTETAALFVRYRGSEPFGGRVTFVAADRDNVKLTGDRLEFIGRNGRIGDPAAMHRVGLSDRLGAAMEPCAAMSTTLLVPADEPVRIVFVIGDAHDEDEARTLIRRYASSGGAEHARKASDEQWRAMKTRVSVSTPEPALDLLMNGWLLYQTLGCRIWGRSSFYQSSGAFGFRDQLQDVLALIPADPAIARAYILKAASRQYGEGDVQHWWHEPLGEGVRTRCSDDRLWLVYAVLEYVCTTGDAAILDEPVSFLEPTDVATGSHDVFERPRSTDERFSLFEHCARALDVSLVVGNHELPLIGTSDWNDGYSQIGVEGKGESVWLGWFLADLLPRMAVIARERRDAERAERYHVKALELRESLDRSWDGAWYRRAYFDDGTPLGSSSNEECRIDSIAQSWAVLSGAGDPLRRRIAMDAVDRLLVDRRNGLIALLTPPFERMTPSPGYIQGYPPGVRENGGQYTHAAAWVIAAFARLGEAGTALELLRMVNPVLRTMTADDCRRYLLEPYLIAGDVYGAGPHAGRGGWSGYTGSSGWVYRVVLEEILGIKLESNAIRVAPRLPNEWRGFTICLRRPRGTLTIDIENRPGAGADRAAQVELDGIVVADGLLPLDVTGDHHARVRLEPASVEAQSVSVPSTVEPS
jgi:cellobiose phosphorylase